MIIGHQKIWQFLEKSVEMDRLSHAYLFSGQEKLGKKTLALEWISNLFGKTPQQLTGGGHPDFILIEPIEGEIKISQIRNLILRLSFHPFLAPLKVAIIDKAHLMNKEAQNCLLKTLEEPKGKTLLILISEYPETLFSTIISRCEIIKFYPVEKKEIENYLKEKGIPQNLIGLITDLSMGKPGLAIDLISDPQKLENQKKVIADLGKLLNSDLVYRFQYAKEISQNSDLEEIFKIWLNYFRNLLLSKIRGEETSKNYNVVKLKNILQKIQNTNFIISTTNVNPRLALETLMLEL